MTDRIKLDELNSDQLDALYDERDRLRADRSRYHRSLQQKTAQVHEQQAALARVQAVADEHPVSIDTALIHEALDGTGPATAEPVVDRQTAVVLAALHHSAETTVTRVINLYEQWVKSGPPPLGTSINRWWDTRLAELHTAINPKEQ